MTVNVICMKWGTRYGPEYVNKLHSMVRKHLTKKFRFVCFTDDITGIDNGIKTQPIPEFDIPAKYRVSPWKKLLIFSKDFGKLKGKTLFLDLDVIIVDNIDCFFDYAKDDFCIIENWTQLGQGIGNSSVYILEMGKYNHIWEDFKKNKLTILEEYDNEQIYLSKSIEKIRFWPDAWCKSFKFHCLPGGILNWFKIPKIPEAAKIIVFHGNPKPEDAMIGRWPGGKWRKHVRPTPWIKKYWC